MQVVKPVHPERVELRLAPIFFTLKEGLDAYARSRDSAVRFDYVYVSNRDLACCMNATRKCRPKAGLPARPFRGVEYRGLGRELGSNVWDGFEDSSDMLIFVGEGSNFVPWETLRERGVYSVLYQTEPMKFGCGVFEHDTYWGTFLRSQVENVDEIWDYSWLHVDSCNQLFMKNYLEGASVKRKAYPLQGPVMRFVPPGYIQNFFPTVNHEKQIEYPVFLGNVKSRPCWNNILAAWAEAVVGKEKLDALGVVFSRTSTYVTAYKDCDASKPYDHSGVCTYVRFSMLLNAGAFNIAQHCYWKDELELRDFIYFSDLSEMKQEFRALQRLTQTERQLKAQKQQSIFQQRFNPAVLFERAGINKLLDDVLYCGNQVYVSSKVRRRNITTADHLEIQE